MSRFSVQSIGKVHNNESGVFIEVDKTYRPALQSLNEYRHINVLWWFSDCDNSKSRSILQTAQPYKGAPKVMGTFATRSPERPNPIALTVVEIIHIDIETGMIQITFIDADDNTPVLDIKPYTPSFDRVDHPGVPAWCSHWPNSTEKSGDFNWEEVFNF